MPGLRKPFKMGSVQVWPPPFVVKVPEPLEPAVREIGFVFKVRIQIYTCMCACQRP